jgi:hypothetical protein
VIDARSRALAIVGCLALLAVIVDLVRRRRLKEEYSVLWVLTAVVLLVMAAWYQLLGWITDAIGGVALSSTLFFLGLLFVFGMLLHFSVRVSALERRLTALVQEIGLLGVRAGAALPAAPDPGQGDPAAASAVPVAPRVAVIIPCYDDGPLVEQAVASVREQEPVEVVVVDDGSSDAGTRTVLDALAARGVRVEHRENGGLAAARATGLAVTSAPFVYPLDADDLLEPGALATMADALERRSETGFAWGDYDLFGDHEGHYRSPERWLPWTLTYVNPYPVCSLFRRDLLERAGDWRGADGAKLVGAQGYEDWDLWLRLVGLGAEGVRVDRTVYRRRLHGSGRLLARARQQHQDLYAELQERNAEVFARRDELRRRERPARWKRAGYPVLFGARKVVPVRIEAFMQRAMMRRGSGLPG